MPPCSCDFNRRPDEEGIKTQQKRFHLPLLVHFNRRPDEEGIKTEIVELPLTREEFQPQT